MVTDRDSLTEAQRSAFFILTSAADAGFSFRAAGVGKLEIVGPPGLAPDLCQPVLDAVRIHGAEILRLIRWLDAEKRQGRVWSPRPGAEARQ
jgi:hypothetical protein